MIQTIDTVFRIDALDRHHGHQYLDLGNLRWIACEQRLDVMGLRALHDEADPIGRNVDAR